MCAPRRHGNRSIFSGVARARCFQTFPGQGLLRGCRFSLSPSYAPLSQVPFAEMPPPFWSLCGGSFTPSNLPLSIATLLRNETTYLQNFEVFPSLLLPPTPYGGPFTTGVHLLKLSGLSLLVPPVKIHFSLSPPLLNSFGPI